MILDIGGQDSKVIALNPDGRVRKFEMNDRCAVGTGKFLELTAMSLGFRLDQFGQEALKAEKDIKINSMCAVFAESEVTFLVGRGENRLDIAYGLHRFIANRAVSMLKRFSLSGATIAFVGGVAWNSCVRRLLEEHLKTTVLVPENPHRFLECQSGNNPVEQGKDWLWKQAHGNGNCGDQQQWQAHG